VETPDIGAILYGSEPVIKWFGGWPNFHDAEIIHLKLARSGESVLRIYPYYPEKPAPVDFILNAVTDLELADFSSQNVIFSLQIETVTDQTKQNAVRLTLVPCYGLSGWLDGRRVRVELVPGQSSDGVSLW